MLLAFLQVCAAGSLSLAQSINPLTAAWQPLGPASVASAAYGKVSGRVTAIALDTNDTTGGTVYIGTTGGGVWKSTNAAGPAGAVTFTPLTDVLPVFAPNAGNPVVPSLSVGAVAVQPLANPVVLAGTGDSNEAADSYYGEGILRSADGGLTWTLAQGSRDGANGRHSFVGLRVAGLAWSTATPTLVVGALSTAAEGAVVSATATNSVPGLYYSTDAGATWQMATVYDGSVVVQQPSITNYIGVPATAVVWNARRQRFYAMLRQHGVYESADGASWKRLAAQPGVGLTTAACPSAVAGPACPMFRGALAVEPVSGDLYALSVDSANNDNGLWQDLCAWNGTACTNASPTFAHRIDAGAMEGGSGKSTIAQGTYNLTLAAAASSGGTTLFAGTADIYRCVLATGTSSCTLRNTTNASNGCTTPAAVAPAQHALAAAAMPGGVPVLFAGNDGGLWRSLDGVAETGATCNAGDAQHFDNLNGALGSLAEVVGFAQDPVDPDTLLVGLGSNGSAATTAGHSAWQTRGSWTQLSTGWGGVPLLDGASAPATWYVATGPGVSLKQCKLGSVCAVADFAGTPTIGAAQVAGDAALVIPATTLDAAQPANILVGTCRVWRGPASGSGWSAANALSKAFDGSTTPCSATSALVRSVAAGGPASSIASGPNAGSTVLYAGMAGTPTGGGTLGGHLFVTKAGATATATTAWTDAALSPVTNDTANAGVFNPYGYDVSSVVVDPHDATGATVYATVMGFGGTAAVAPHVYRSTDFGGHWLNVTANLAATPANALVVDPNDANTVYVAMDAGVYVTQQIATCATQSCWSVFGTSLPNSPVTALAAAANMPTGDGRKGMLRAGTYGRGLWSLPLLTAVGTMQGGITLSATGLTFAAQAVATQSSSQKITITSSGSGPLVVSAVNVTGDFVESDTCTGMTLAVGVSCAVQIMFAPTAVGARSGVLTAYANVAGGQVTVNLNGVGTAPAAIALSPLALTFAETVVNQTAAAQIVNVANTGSATETLQVPTVSGDFAISANTCGTTLAAQTACAVSISFTPTARGSRSGTLTLVDNAGTQMVALSGTGNSPATDALSGTSLTFTATQIGSVSVAQQVLLSNAGDTPLLLVSAAILNGPFTAASACGTSLAAHSTCAINIMFVPTTTGTATGVLAVGDLLRSQQVVLSGVGTAPPGVSLTPVAGLTFANTGVGLTSPAQAITLTNNGGVTLTIASAAVSGDFYLSSSTCGASLAPGSACTMAIVFTPSTSGLRAGTLTLIDNAPGSTQNVALSGIGVDFNFVASGATSVTIVSGASAQFPLLLTSAAGLSGTVAMSCAGAPAHSTCLVTPVNTALGSTTSVIATVQTGTAQAQLVPGPRSREWIVLAMLVPATLIWKRRRAAKCTLVVVAGLIVFASNGCGTGRDIPASGSGATTTPTPAGTYTLTVTAVSAGVSHDVKLTLVVQ